MQFPDLWRRTPRKAHFYPLLRNRSRMRHLFSHAAPQGDPSDFLRFGLSHTLGVSLIVFGMLAVVAGCRQPRWRRLVGSSLCLCTFGFVVQSYWNRRDVLTLGNALPLHLCDLIMMLAFFGFFQVARGRLPGERVSELLYYWGFGLSIHALITPDLTVEFPHWRWIEFFWGHGLIFWGLACVTTVQGFPWTGAAALRCWLSLNVYILSVGFLNWATGWNYGYLCQRPLQGSALDLLGPWPLYLVLADMLIGFEFWLLWLPVEWIRRNMR
jgi:hypothetical integral membrane protein (TIGR02206 family)